MNLEAVAQSLENRKLRRELESLRALAQWQQSEACVDIELLQDAVASVRAVSARLGLFLPVALLTNPANPSPLTSLVLGAEAVSRNMSYYY